MQATPAEEHVDIIDIDDEGEDIPASRDVIDWTPSSCGWVRYLQAMLTQMRLMAEGQDLDSRGRQAEAEFALVAVSIWSLSSCAVPIVVTYLVETAVAWHLSTLGQDHCLEVLPTSLCQLNFNSAAVKEGRSTDHDFGHMQSPPSRTVTRQSG